MNARSLLPAVVLLVYTFIGFASQSEAVGSAGCLIRSGGRLVMVEDHWSGRWSLPAGRSEQGETAKKTAEREAFEEIGLRVRVHSPVLKINAFTLFSCTMLDRVPVLKGRDGALVLSVPLHSNDEIQRIALINPAVITAADWRFPKQAAAILQVLADAADSADYFVLKTPASDGSLTWQQVPLIKALQGASWLKVVMQVFNFFGERNFFFLVLPWLLIGRWRRFGLILTGAVLLSGILNGIIKDLFEYPRPLTLDPLLGLMQASGYGFPSGHTQVAATFYGIIGWRFRKWLMPCMILAAGTGLARVYFGAHFFHDVVAGWLIGLTIAFLALRFWNHRVIVLLLLLSLPIRFHPDSVAMFLVYVGLFLFLKTDVSKRCITNANRAFSAIVTTLGLFVIPQCVGALFTDDRTFVNMLSKHILSYLLLGFWLGGATAFLPRLFASSARATPERPLI